MSSRHCARLGSNLSAVWRIFFFAFSKFKYYFFIICDYFLILPKNLEMPSRGTHEEIPRLKNIVSMCECCCPFFIFCLFLAFQRKVRILTTQKSLTTMHLVNFYRWSQSTTLSNHLSFFCLLGSVCNVLQQWFSNYVPRHNTVPRGYWKCAARILKKFNFIKVISNFWLFWTLKEYIKLP